MASNELLEIIANEKRNPTGTLNLARRRLAIIPKEVLELLHLQSLFLNDNQILDMNILEKLPNLEYLDLRYNKISDISFLEKLPALRSLDLRSNQIWDIGILEKLPNLQSLDLSRNKISDIGILEKLTQLKYLHLNDNQISDIGMLEKLPHLQSLGLRSNQISDISILEKLPHLKSLDLNDNQLSDLSFLEKLPSLKSLYLGYNRLSDIRILEKLPNLEYLGLSSNQLSDISSLKKLSNLQYLYLQVNQINKIGILKNLKKLKTINLNDNHIKELPPWITDRSFDIVYEDGWNSGKMTVHNNPLESPPIEIVKKGRDAIKKYFKDLEQQGKDYIYEAKLLMVGDGGAGKTSLAWKMKQLDCAMPKEGEDRTQGIDIQAMPITNIKNPEVPFLMNVWDFGGQGYYHSTHQFFLTKRSLYVLLNNTRINKTDFNDWLQTIALFSDNSPVILVENEVGGSKSELDLRGLQSYFNNILYVKVADLANITDGRLESLIRDIEFEIQRLPHIGSKFPKQWVKIRKSLKEIAKTKAYISDREFYNICKQHKIVEKDAMQRLGDLFHDLGVFLHFRDDKVLKRIVILQNAWATKGVYTILDNVLVRTQNGYFTIEQAEEIWKNTAYEDLHDEMVSLMEKFRLCYRIPYAVPTAYISPNLLPVEQPDYHWDNHQNLVIIYEYEFMPKGLLGMLIVELHRFVKDIKKMAWRNGCVFHYQNTDALIIETYGKKKLEIRIKGAHCVNLSSIIISEIDRLNASFKRIKVKKLIPCPCPTDQQAEGPNFFNYEDLMRRKAKNKLTVECSICYKDVQVLEVLEATYNEAFTKEPTIKELIKEGKIKEAIDLFEQDFPKEGTLLLSKFNQLERLFYLGLMTQEEWSVNKQQIAKSILELSYNQSQVSTNKELDSLKQLDKKLQDMETQLKESDVLLNTIIERSNKIHQYELLELLNRIEKEKKYITEDFANDIITIIEKGMKDFSLKHPDSKHIIKDWQQASAQLQLTGDFKEKLKWAIPFLFLKLDKDIHWKGKDWFQTIKEDIKRGEKGNWNEMFTTD